MNNFFAINLLSAFCEDPDDYTDTPEPGQPTLPDGDDWDYDYPSK